MIRAVILMATTAAVPSASSTSQATAFTSQATAFTHVTQAAGLATPGAGAATPRRGCPAPRTCAAYSLKPYRWPTVKGFATLQFSVNPVQVWVPQQDAVQAASRAAAAWASASPKVKVAPVSTTTSLPRLGDGQNVIAWTQLDAGTLAAASVWVKNGKVVEADIALNALIPWAWTPCAPTDGSCTPAAADAGLVRRFDLQSVLTHEVGHWLGIGHLDGAAAAELTMFTTPNPGERKQVTLALGDVAGVRAAYPCPKCRMPRIAVP